MRYPTINQNCEGLCIDAPRSFWMAVLARPRSAWPRGPAVPLDLVPQAMLFMPVAAGDRHLINKVNRMFPCCVSSSPHSHHRRTQSRIHRGKKKIYRDEKIINVERGVFLVYLWWWRSGVGVNDSLCTNDEMNTILTWFIIYTSQAVFRCPLVVISFLRPFLLLISICIQLAPSFTATERMNLRIFFDAEQASLFPNAWDCFFFFFFF